MYRTWLTEEDNEIMAHQRLKGSGTVDAMCEGDFNDSYDMLSLVCNNSDQFWLITTGWESNGGRRHTLKPRYHRVFLAEVTRSIFDEVCYTFIDERGHRSKMTGRVVRKFRLPSSGVKGPNIILGQYGTYDQERSIVQMDQSPRIGMYGRW